MKNYASLIYICITLTCINLFAFLFYFQSLNPKSTENYLSDANISAGQIFPTIDVAFPKAIDFAGESTPLERIDIQEALRKELIVNTYLHSLTIQNLKTAPRMFALIEPILKEYKIPNDFKYLAVIESNLNPSATSPAGAVGIWQFLKGTGEEAGLEINDEVDERYNIEKSTIAATAYLKKAYDRFGAWTLAAASYNAGSAMLSRQMNIQKVNNYYSLLLGEETERYVFRILALKQIINHPNDYNFFITESYPIEETRKVKVNTPIGSWADFAIKEGISYKTLKRFNPWLRKPDLKNPRRKTYEITIPRHPENYQ